MILRRYSVIHPLIFLRKLRAYINSLIISVYYKDFKTLIRPLRPLRPLEVYIQEKVKSSTIERVA